MSIGSWQRSTPGATSVTSAAAAPAPGGGGGRPSSASVRVRRPARRPVAGSARWPGRCTRPGGRSAGCCCGRTVGCRRHGATARRSPSSCPPATRPTRCRTSSLPCSPQLRPGDELVVVDDHSADATAAVAAAHGATVVAAPALPPGWVGKPHACWIGAGATTAPVLVFVDADVRPGPDLLDGLAAAVAADDVVVSVQPWHDAAPGERRPSLANVVTLMGSGGVHRARRRLRTTVAFGPVLAVTRRDLRPRRRARPPRRAGQPHRGHRPRPPRRPKPLSPARRRRACTRCGRAVAGGRGRWPPGSPRRGGGWPLAVAAWVWSLAGGLFAGWLGLPARARCRCGCSAGGPVASGRSPPPATRCSSSCSSSSSSARWRTALRGVTTWKGRPVRAA